MAWELEISTIDVGQGESSLIIAQDVGGIGGSRTMLIDAGRAGRAKFVMPYVRARLAARGIARLNHLLVSHYDVDHSGGVLTLLNNDNLWQLCALMAAPAIAAWNAAGMTGATPGDCAAAAAAAACATCRGAYDLPGHQYAFRAPLAAQQALMKTNPTIRQGAEIGREYMENYNRNLSLLITPQSFIGAAMVAGTRILAGPQPVSTAQVATAIHTAIQAQVKNPVATYGLLRDTQVIDIGVSPHRPTEYIPELQGRLDLKGGTAVNPPGTARTHLEVFPNDNGDELLWHTGGGAIPAPANSPAAFLVANNKWIWRAPNGACPIQGQPDNADSIGLMVRFANFFFYTGGDLPWQGEDLVGNSIMANQLPNPQGGNPFALPARIAAIKCGHHGSDHSTSAAFLQTINPRAATISSGKAQFQNENHPAQGVLNRLEAQVNTGVAANDLELFYLTNCNYPRTYVAMSNGADQLAPTSHSRVAGDNSLHNSAANHVRGNQRLFLTQAESTGNQFHVEYYENKPNVLLPAVFGVHPAIGPRTENHVF
jgi:beta-lactamase superfamily II metal-dependent hydrolase